MKKLFYIAIIIPLLFSSCKKDPEPVVDTGLTDVMARDSLYYLMRQWYYWYDLMPTIKKENYADPYQLLEAMKYKTLDKWSFVADYNEFVAEMQGEFVGHGIRVGLDDSGKARIAMIYSGSPLYKVNGVRRGWIVKSVNGYDIAKILTDKDAAAYNTAFGASTAGVTNKFVFTKPDGTDIEISSVKTSFTINSVLLYDTLHLSTGITGHLVFESFISPSPAELAAAFKFFEENNIKDLILDLRYNSGGYLSVAQTLATEIGGKPLANSGSVFGVLKYNDKNQDQNYSYKFDKSVQVNISLTRLIVISSRLTASASEAVMNGLKPFMNIITIGDTTSGKPVGMNGWQVGEKYFFWPITFKIVNKDNEGDYFNGIIPDKLVSDDITHDFNDRNELCLKEAIKYIETGTFSTKGSDSFYRYNQYSEKPQWSNRGLMIR
jgi:carboxyl-terminal processing protease